MKKNDNTSGFQLPISISETTEIITANFRAARDIILALPEGVLSDKTQDRLADAVVTIDHSEAILDKNSDWVTDLIQEKKTVTVLSGGTETDKLKDKIAAIRSGLSLLEVATLELTPQDNEYKQRIYIAVRDQTEHLIELSDEISKQLPDYSPQSV